MSEVERRLPHAALSSAGRVPKAEKIAALLKLDSMAGKRLRKGGRVFEIVTVHDPDERGRYLVCLAREV